MFPCHVNLPWDWCQIERNSGKMGFFKHGHGTIKVITSCQSWFLLKKLHCESGFTGSANVEFEHMFIGSSPYLSYGPRFLFVRFKPFWILLSATLRRVPSLPAPCSIVIQVGAQCGCQSSEAQHRCMAQKWSIVGGLRGTNRLLRGNNFSWF